jgi:alkyl hydroperoxide reductase subunit D
MSIEILKERLPDYAKDLKLNLSSLINNPEGMTEQQLWGSLLVAALAGRNDEVIRKIHADAAEHLDEAALNAAKAANAVMAMNNVYYSSMGRLPESYRTLPARLRMNVMVNPGVDKNDFELWSVVVSSINGCGFCLAGHEQKLVENGFKKETVQHAIRIGAVIHAIAVVLETEGAMLTDTAS